MYEHIFVVGGTGMLKQASIQLAHTCKVMTSVASTKESLKSLSVSLEAATCTHHTLQLDWLYKQAFLDAIESHVKNVGAPDLTLAWLHDDSMGPELASVLGYKESVSNLFFQVRGSSAVTSTGQIQGFSDIQEITETARYYQILLGFVVDDNNVSRWLSHAEIVSGVLSALQSPKPITHVGILDRDR